MEKRQELITTTQKGMLPAQLSEVADKAITIISKTSLTKVEDCINPAYPSVASLRVHEPTRKQLHGFIKLMIIEVNEFLNVDGLMTERQIDITADLLINEYWYLNLADIKLFTQRGMAGKYGKVYNRIDGEIIFKWATTYWEERMEVAEQMAGNKYSREKTYQEDKPVSREDILKMYEEYKTRETSPDQAEIDKKKEADLSRLKSNMKRAEEELSMVPPVPEGLEGDELKAAEEEYRNKRFDILKKYGAA